MPNIVKWKPKPLPKDKKKAAVAIAKDVLLQIKKKKKIVATPGTYVSPGGLIGQRIDREIFNNDAQEDKFRNDLYASQLGRLVAEMEGFKCDACALGSMAVSFARLHNHLTLGDADSRDGIQAKLKKFFSDDALDAIEDCFELTSMNNTYFTTEAWQNAFSQTSATSRLKAIMANIIRNKGDFVPADTRGPLAKGAFKPAKEAHAG